MRILALDWGQARIGGAISDEEGKFAFPLEKFIKPTEAIEEIKKLTIELGVQKILIGIPVSMSGTSTDSTEQARRFMEKIRTEVRLPVEEMDERLSSVAASRTLSSQGVKQKDQRGMTDNVAAQLMLQQYLDTNTK